jgi:hypothetical protein
MVTIANTNVISATVTDSAADPPRSNTNKKRITAALNFETLFIPSPKIANNARRTYLAFQS